MGSLCLVGKFNRGRSATNRATLSTFENNVILCRYYFFFFSSNKSNKATFSYAMFFQCLVESLPPEPPSYLTDSQLQQLMKSNYTFLSLWFSMLQPWKREHTGSHLACQVACKISYYKCQLPICNCDISKKEVYCGAHTI